MIWYPERIFSNGLKPIVQTIVFLLRMDTEVRRIAVTGVPIWVCTHQDMEQYILKPENLQSLWDQAIKVVIMQPSIAAIVPLNSLDYVKFQL